jgi:hypothetical protein
LFTLSARGSVLGRIDWPGRCTVMHVDDAAAMLIALATSPLAADQLYCTGNPHAPTVGELARRIAHVCGTPKPVYHPPDWFWRAVRRATWNPVVQRVGLAVAPLLFWRFSLIVDDGFWVDAEKVQSVFSDVPVDLDAGLHEMLARFTDLFARLS